MIRTKRVLALSIAAVLGLSSCKKERSSVTGWDYNDPNNGGFEKAPFADQETGPGLILVEGGTFTMGRMVDDVMYEWQNTPRRVTVSSFYMDETEVTNFHWLEYLYWLNRVFGVDYPKVFTKALPDTLVWRDKLAYNEPYVEYYLRHPAYRDYPVVGVNWLQAVDFCAWRTDRVNEIILIREGLFEHYTNQVNEDNFNTDAYLVGQYESGKKIEGVPDLHPNRDFRNIRMEDGVLLPRYRLPTEAEWEYASYGLIGNSVGERVVERRTWSWSGHAVRNPEEKYLGMMLANFKRGNGDNMGVAGKLNDNADVTAPVYSYWPNDYGLYNMAGNVSEWVMDVYRPMTHDDATDFRPFRGNVFKTVVKDQDNLVAEKDSLGKLVMRNVTEEENVERRNYRRSDNINFLDADWESNIRGNWTDQPEAEQKSFKLHVKHAPEPSDEPESNMMYDYTLTSMINDKARVYKGGSWKDRAFYMNPGTRRYLDEKQSTSYIGFRCVMDRLGSPRGMNMD